MFNYNVEKSCINRFGIQYCVASIYPLAVVLPLASHKLSSGAFAVMAWTSKAQRMWSSWAEGWLVLLWLPSSVSSQRSVQNA